MSEDKTKQLIGGSFLIKESSKDQIFTPEDLNEEQRMMRAAVKEFMDREVWPQKDRVEKKDFALVEKWVRELGEMGMLGITVPEEYGGLGLSMVDSVLICDYVSGCTGSLATAYGAHTGIGTLPILLYGNAEQKEKYLPKLATGEWIGAYCLTEPEAGSDANAGKTKAVITEDGSHYLITGQKMWISNAGFADVFIVFARIEDDKNITGFIVTKDMIGENFSLGEEEPKLGLNSSSTRQLFFNNLKVPAENMLGDRNGGFKIAMNALNIGRVKLAAASLDAQRRIIDNAVKYANERKQFGTPISTFGAVQEMLANIALACYTSESGVYRAAKDIQDKIQEYSDAGKDHQEAELRGIEEYAIECSVLKVFGSEAIQHSADTGIQVFGGMGYSKDVPMESAWRDSRIARIYEGTNEINRLLSVSMLVKKALKGQIDLLSPAKNIQDELMSIPSFDVPDYSELFAQEKEILAGLKKVFLMVSGAALQKFGMELEQQQQLILGAADILIEIYMAESAMLRAEKLSANNQSDQADYYVKLAKWQMFKSSEIVKTRAHEGIVSFAEGDEQRMMLSGLRRFTRYTEYPNVVQLKTEIAQHLIDANGYVTA
ncbi:MAG: acyl-CoA dehydrogenase family protein [Weeksellaceae bacterium]|nr:acyl-CoA dehydrogenase family protein [Weeksellaceae bacterium]